MILDYRSSEVDADLDCQLCIIGGGAAGITLATALMESGIDIALLESGGLEFDREVQSLYDGSSVGLANASPTGCRLRYFGGTTNHWTGWCAPLRDIDFEPRPWLSLNGWPIRRAELLPWYAKAQAILQLGTGGFGADALGVGDFPAFDAQKVTVESFRFSPPTRFGQVYRERLDGAARVRVFLHANVLKLETDAAASEVQRIRIRSLEGKQGVVRARFVVLACGGMENARLLLLSNDAQAEGLGNGSGLVGRYFMQHIEGTVARILAVDSQVIQRLFARHAVEGVDMRAELSIAAAAQARHGLLDAGFTLNSEPDYGPGYEALGAILKDLRRGHWPDELASRLRTLMSDLGSVGAAVFSKPHFDVALYARAEPSPNPDSRISLDSVTDRFGQPRIKVDWRLLPRDRQSLLEAVQRVAEEFGRLELGRLQIADWVLANDEKWPQPLWGGCHHMGTTRMSAVAGDGVVDPDCRVHSVRNLYVAGSSVFVTAGYVPPTLTLVALALRLADHLQQRLRET